MTMEQRIKRIIKQTENDLLQTIEQDCQLITTLKTQRDNLLDVAREIVSDFDNYGEVLQTGFDGEYGNDTAIGRLVIIVDRINKP
ncbi:hypothetical protein LCGC14_0573910 [marine sediment metagenome]|uniref:Uncharacterized protein n=1 Tax=marine sediment metagenome TaxID=412755 RepID=A0A0F9U4M6_9ZZZZ